MKPERPSAYKRIVLFGTYAEENTGDDYMLVSQIFGIRDRYPDSRLTIFTGDCERSDSATSIDRLSAHALLEEGFLADTVVTPISLSDSSV